MHMLWFAMTSWLMSVCIGSSHHRWQSKKEIILVWHCLNVCVPVRSPWCHQKVPVPALPSPETPWMCPNLCMSLGLAPHPTAFWLCPRHGSACQHSLWCIAWFPWRAKQPAGPVLCLPSQHSTTRSMVHQSMASHLQGWGHLLHWGHSHTPMFIRVNLYAVLQCTVCLYKCLLCPVDLAELCPNQHDSSAEAQGVKCRSVVQVSQVAKHSSCERFIFSTSTVRLRGQRSTKPAKQTSCR